MINYLGQLVGQNSKPKTEDCGTLKNWGFPSKKCHAYL